MKRQKHSLSHYKLLTCDMGKLVPVGLVEALPGDTFQHSTSMLLRMSPLIAPVMHPVSVRLHHWFVPNRLVFSDWEKFITGGKDGLGDGSVYPTNAGIITPAKGDILDYMGVPVGVAHPVGTLGLMPIRGYNKIYNEFYRDQDLVTEVTQNATDTLRVAWEKDYFTTTRPWTQKGPAVTIPIGGQAPVIGIGKVNQNFPVAGGDAWETEDTAVTDYPFSTLVDETSGADSQYRIRGSAATGGTPLIYADLESMDSPEVIAFRRAFALQRYQEARAQYGSRYTEYLRYLGVRSSDARLQRPEYLGGGKQTISFSEVLRTGNVAGEEDTNPIGEMKGHGIAAMRSNRYRYFCEEHGYIMTLLSIRPRSMYVDGLDRTWSRRTKEDYYQKELELIGQQEVYKRELNVEADATDSEVFGYQDRYAEYRHQYSNVAGDFRDTLNYWHLARSFAASPTLNQSFIDCDPTKRIFAEQTAHSCWIMVSHSIQCRRMVGKQTIGRII